jgi:hypothetical protein
LQKYEEHKDLKALKESKKVAHGYKDRNSVFTLKALFLLIEINFIFRTEIASA